MKNQAFYARLRNARSFLRFCQDTHSELSVLKKDGTVTPFNAGAVASWNKWAQTGTFKTSGKALTRRERKRLARGIYREVKWRRRTALTRSQVFALTKSAYPKKATTLTSGDDMVTRSRYPHWFVAGMITCNTAARKECFKRAPQLSQWTDHLPARSGSSGTAILATSEHMWGNGSKFYLSGVTAHQTAEPPHHYLLDEAFGDGAKYSEPGAVEKTLREEVGQEAIDAFEKSFTVNLEDPDSVAKGARIAKRSLRRL